jgi:hypothetical protein
MLKALQEGRNRRDLQLLANADLAVQDRINFGTQQLDKASGLLGTGYDLMQGSLAPYQSYLGEQAKLEELAQQPFQMGLNAGATAMTGQQYGADSLQDAALNQAKVAMGQAQNKYDVTTGLLKNKELMEDVGGLVKGGIDKIGGLFSGGVPGFGGGSFGGGQAVPYSAGMSTPGLMFGQRSY